MAGLFSSNYAKPGKGVDKNAPQKHRFLLFFDLYFRKFFKFMELNLIYFVITFPLAAFFTMIGIQMLGLDFNELANDVLIMAYTFVVAHMATPGMQIIWWILVAISAILFGPVTAGMTYILRNFAREEHAWIFSDLYERSKQNFRQGLIAGLIDIILIFSFLLYMGMQPVDGMMGHVTTIFRYIVIAVFIIYQIMRFYLYTIMVTFDMKFIAILKNSFLFSVLGLFKNLLSILFCAIAIALSFFEFSGLCLDFVFFPLITLSLTGFIVVFNSYPTIKKFMIDPLMERDEDNVVEIEYEDETATEETEQLFIDDVTANNAEQNNTSSDK